MYGVAVVTRFTTLALVAGTVLCGCGGDGDAGESATLPAPEQRCLDRWNEQGDGSGRESALQHEAAEGDAAAVHPTDQSPDGCLVQVKIDRGPTKGFVSHWHKGGDSGNWVFRLAPTKEQPPVNAHLRGDGSLAPSS